MHEPDPLTEPRIVPAQGTARLGSKLVCLEGLRGVAATIVVVCHLQGAFFPDVHDALRQTFKHWARYGNHRHRITPALDAVAPSVTALVEAFLSGDIAAWTFWVLSGFVLSFRFFALARESQHRPALRYLLDAALRRYPRLLLPVAASAGFAALLMVSGAMGHLRLMEVIGPQYGHWVIGRFYRLDPSLVGWVKSVFWETFFAFNDHTTYNSVLWTMEKEFAGSMFVFGFLAVAGRSGLRWILYPAAAAAFAAGDLQWLNAFVAGMVLSDLHVLRHARRHDPLPSPTAGAESGVLARVQCLANRLRGSTAFTLVIALVLLRLIGIPKPSESLMLVLAAACTATTLALRPADRFFASRIPAFLGRISFAVYLIHLPLICSFYPWLYLTLTGHGLGHAGAVFAGSTATVLLSIGLGYPFYLAFDKPAPHFARLISTALLAPFRGRPPQTAPRP